MKGYFLILTALLVLSVIGSSYAFPYSTASATNTIYQTTSSFSISRVLYSFTLFNAPSETNLSLPLGVYNITLLSGGRKINFITFPSKYCRVLFSSQPCITLQIPGVSGNESYSLSYYYKTYYSPNQNTFNSTLYLIPPYFLASLQVTTELPAGGFLPHNAYTVPPPSNFSSNGKNIFVHWSIINQTTGGIELPFTIAYSDNFSGVGFPMLYLYVITAVIVLAVGIVIWRNFSIKRPDAAARRKQRRNPFVGILSTDEKKVMAILRKDKFLVQKDIVSLTGFSKAKVSKIIAKLSRYKLLKIKQDGKFTKIKRR